MFDDVDDDELDLLPEETRDDDEQTDMPTMGEVSIFFCTYLISYLILHECFLSIFYSNLGEVELLRIQLTTKITAGTNEHQV